MRDAGRPAGGALMTTKMCSEMKTPIQIRYEEGLGAGRMVGGGVTGGDTTTSLCKATMTDDN